MLNPRMFQTINTPRLSIRSFLDGDVAAFHARRNDPHVSKYQDWSVPYLIEDAVGTVRSLLAMDGPTNEEWWMAAVVDSESGAVIGDLSVELTQGGRSAEVGYTFDRESWGHGFAVEALDALIKHLFEAVAATRVFGMLHPDNVASAMVLERCGLMFEGHTKSSFWLDGECSDDWIYGTTRVEWETWRNRPRTVLGEVRLIEVNADNERAVGRLVTHKSQERFVSPVILSFGDAMFPEVVDDAPLVPWMRAGR